MLYNSACTVYRAAEHGFERTFIPECFWQESRGAAIAKGGIIADAGIIVYIPEKYAELAPRTVQKDMLVKGECSFKFDNSSEKTISDGSRTLRGYKPVTVKSVDSKLYGSALRHIKVAAV